MRPRWSCMQLWITNLWKKANEPTVQSSRRRQPWPSSSRMHSARRYLPCCTQTRAPLFHTFFLFLFTLELHAQSLTVTFIAVSSPNVLVWQHLLYCIVWWRLHEYFGVLCDELFSFRSGFVSPTSHQILHGDATDWLAAPRCLKVLHGLKIHSCD